MNQEKVCTLFYAICSKINKKRVEKRKEDKQQIKQKKK
jgi:hypothetical protein